MMTGPPARNSGQSEPTDAATSFNAAVENGEPASGSSAPRAAAASLLPPPRPAPTGILLCSVNRAPAPYFAATANAQAAFRTRFDSSTLSEESSQQSENPVADSTSSVSPKS